MGSELVPMSMEGFLVFIALLIVVDAGALLWGAESRRSDN
jgi:hypothetical protein